MRAVVIRGKLDAEVARLPMPEPGDGEIRLRMAFGGICGSDLHYYFEGANGPFVVREPLVPGHEVTGVVDLDPTGTYAEGTEVTVHPATFGTCRPGLEGRRHLWPGGAYLGSASTWPHTQGGMSEYLVVAADMVRALPESVSLRTGTLAEPLAVALHGIEVAGGVEGRRVLVSGAGPIGLLSAAAALMRGAAHVTATDLLAGPLRRAEALGVTQTLQVGHDELPDEAFDVVLECSGSAPALNAAVRAVRRAGVIVQVGTLPTGALPLELATLVSKEAQLRGCFRFLDEIDEALTLLEKAPSLEAVITHVVPADDHAGAFSAAQDSQASGKVIVSLWRDDREDD